jgi:hypothetical protein
MRNRAIGRASETASAYLPAIALLVASTLAIGWLNFRPADAREPTLAIFSPRTTFEQTLLATARAGGSIVARGPFPFSLVVQSKDPLFFKRLQNAGALLLLDAKGGGCSDRRRQRDISHDE